MDGITNEMLYYGGLALAALALVVGVVSGLILKIRSMRLNMHFDREYGEKQ